MATKPQVRFVVAKEKRDYSSDTTVVLMNAVHMVPPEPRQTFMGRPDEGVRNGLSSEDPPIAAIADLALRAQKNDDIMDGRFYGWDVRYYNVYSVDIQYAKIMASTLTKIEKHLAKLADRFGYPTDYAAYAARIADYFGAETRCFGIRCEEMRPDGSYWKWLDVDGLRQWLFDETGAK